MAAQDDDSSSKPESFSWQELAIAANDMVELLHHHGKAFTIASGNGSTTSVLRFKDAVIYYMAARAFLEASKMQLDLMDATTREQIDAYLADNLVDVTPQRKKVN